MFFVDGTDLLTQNGMANATRMVLCAFMLGVLAFNPFSAIFGKLGSEQDGFDYDISHKNTRMLHGWDEVGEYFVPLVSWEGVYGKCVYVYHIMYYIFCRNRKRLAQLACSKFALWLGKRPGRCCSSGTHNDIRRTCDKTPVRIVCVLLEE